jgi:hypothetical protein
MIDEGNSLCGWQAHGAILPDIGMPIFTGLVAAPGQTEVAKYE